MVRTVSSLIVGSLLALSAACQPASGQSSGSQASDTQASGSQAPAPAEGQAAAPADQAAGAAAVAAPPAAAGDRNALTGQVYGDGVTQTQAVAISELLANPDAYAGKTVRVEGTVTDVCPKRGCWFEMAGQKPGEKVRFKVQDGVMTFPMDIKGNHAVAEGVVVKQALTLEQSREYAAYQAREYGADIDPASITEPITIVRLDGKGAVIQGGK